MWATSVIFKKIAQSEQSPIGRKFAQSGHPDDDYYTMPPGQLKKTLAN
jgi:hypothetical protein